MEPDEAEKRKREEYEMQLFGFHCRDAYASFKTYIFGRIQSKCEKLFKTLEEQYKLESENHALLKTNKEQLIKAYHEACLPNLKNIENNIYKFIAVPPHILCNEDKLQATQYTETEFENLQKKLDDLQLRAKKATIVNAAFKDEFKMIKQITLCQRISDKVQNSVWFDMRSWDVNAEIRELTEEFNKFMSDIDKVEPVSEKALYNTIDDLKCIDTDMNDLKL